MADYNYYQRPRFYKKKHPIRNFFIVLALLIVVALGVFVYIGYSDSQKTTTPIQQKVSKSSTVDEKIDSNSSSSDDSSSSSETSSESSSSSSSASSSSQDTAAEIKESAKLKGKTLAEAKKWAIAHNRYYSWVGSDSDIVTKVTDDGHDISFVASSN
ncbi:hypothetical protein BMS77_07075 [Leuconostoc pseudomesenteroides]|uniref:Uncharacterized protein n=1 Tax=Leuconostoc pseudomesenteroides TaxID=33968 RepID=A0A1X0VF31_LEUPS|nr:hypothetical protein [Leuconostoc pseudomesenteroides]OQJ71300.1 hypothetical protein BMS77_07075 [Leuconostoc pseudomesenteroides]OQJ74520.1 hypothetical protein BMS83_09640 [Leuconostoc pseudomesenteroides]OQJ78502.1 hypothetical protein BMS82_02600 [Leuconostoc pseudomesenteroides]ORI38036.1 hypothetical protein BMR88_02915 [Leuconostoc pseudomesenteroides]ORI46560.1 hypothetical protein BMR94_02245 [Leuconostoc pseudomesenteroides]